MTGGPDFSLSDSESYWCGDFRLDYYTLNAGCATVYCCIPVIDLPDDLIVSLSMHLLLADISLF